MIICGINYNRIIPHPFYLGVYQDEANKLELYKVINNIFGLKPNQQENLQNGGARFSVNIGNKIKLNIPLIN